MSNLEGDGIMELIYYLLWRKDSPYNEQMNICIPDTIIFRKGRPVSWYFTNHDGTVLKKKLANVTFDNIVKAFTKNAKNGDIVGYFINIDEEATKNKNKHHHKMAGKPKIEGC
jgi:hypothetical protein